jgi:hypothetical protein
MGQSNSSVSDAAPPEKSMAVDTRNDAVSVLNGYWIAVVSANDSLIYQTLTTSFYLFLVAEIREKWKEDMLLLPRNKKS